MPRGWGWGSIGFISSFSNFYRTLFKTNFLLNLVKIASKGVKWRNYKILRNLNEITANTQRDQLLFKKNHIYNNKNVGNGNVERLLILWTTSGDGHDRKQTLTNNSTGCRYLKITQKSAFIRGWIPPRIVVRYLSIWVGTSIIVFYN